MMRAAAVLLAAVTPLALADYSYSYGPSPTPAPTATAAPTRTDTYAPTRMTEAPSYAPTTDTYAPTFSSCPNLVDVDTCPADPVGLPLCSAIGLATGDKCITGPQICPDQPGPTNCPAAFQVVRRLLPKVHGPVTRAFHGWTQRRFKASSEATRRRLATPAECANGACFVAQVGMADPTAAPTALPTPMSAPFVIGAVTLSGITLDDAEASKAVLQNAVADVAGVEPDAVTITGVASARRRLQGGVVLDYVIQTAGNAEATDVSTALDAAADDPSLVDTAIAAAAAAAGAEEVFAGVTTEDITNDIAVSAPPTPLPTTTSTTTTEETAVPSAAPTGYVMTDSTIRTAVALWLDDRAAAEATYGHISTWETGGVTDMSWLFCNRLDWYQGDSYFDDCVLSTSSFNEDIGAWDTSGVKTMYGMFNGASSFNQDIGGWAVHSVTSMWEMFIGASAFNQDIGNWAIHSVKNMRYMFYDASAFDQDLGWCVADDVDLMAIFYNQPCASTWCGVKVGQFVTASGSCESTPAPTVYYDGVHHTDESIRTAVTAWLWDASTAEATYGHISTWETGGVTDMSFLFCGFPCSQPNSWCSDCNTLAGSFNEDIGAWDTSGVTRMDHMFYYASAFNGDIGAWDTSGVTRMDDMFYYASAFNGDIGGWAVHSVTDMRWMFYRASAFNQDIGNWAVHSVKNMRYMFYEAAAFDQDLRWCVDVGVDLELAFWGTPCRSTSCGVVRGSCAPTLAPTTSLAPTATPAPTVTPLVADDSTIRTAVALWLSDRAAAEAAYGHISTWETGGVTDMSRLFRRASSFNEDIGAWDTSGVTSMSLLFYGASSFNEDIGAWDTSGVMTMYKMFYYASAFDQDLGAWDTSGVTSMEYMFYYASAFDQDLGWCVDDGVSLDAAFADAKCESTFCGVRWEVNAGECVVSSTGNVMVNWKIKQAVAAWLSNATAAEATYGHISTWHTSGVTDMDSLFCADSVNSFCNTAAASFNEDIGAWDTSGVTRMDYLFGGASSFNQDISAWDTSGVKTMYGIFSYASAFDQDIGAWNTSGVTTMRRMFNRASAFNQDLSDWAVHSVTDMRYMSYDASAFDQDLGWCVNDGVRLARAFYNTPCESTSCGVTRKNEFDECEAIGDIDFDDYDDDNDDDDDDDY